MDAPSTSRAHVTEDPRSEGASSAETDACPLVGMMIGESERAIPVSSETGATFTWAVALTAGSAADATTMSASPWPTPVTTPESNDPRTIATAARFSEELGADVIKTRYSGTEDDRLIAENCTVPVLVLGGPKSDHETYFAFVADAIARGASGVAVGRNITQDPKPLAVVSALSALVHENATGAQAMGIYSDIDQ